MNRLAHLVAGSPVIVSTRGHGAARTEHTVEHATPSHLFVDGERYRRGDGRLRGSAPCDHRCPRLEVS